MGRIKFSFWRRTKDRKHKDDPPWPKSNVLLANDPDKLIRKLLDIECSKRTRVDDTKVIHICVLCKRYEAKMRPSGQKTFSVEWHGRKYKWHESAIHYMLSHRVLPDEKFVKFIKGYKSHGTSTGIRQDSSKEKKKSHSKKRSSKKSKEKA